MYCRVSAFGADLTPKGMAPSIFPLQAVACCCREMFVHECTGTALCAFLVLASMESTADCQIPCTASSPLCMTLRYHISLGSMLGIINIDVPADVVLPHSTQNFFSITPNLLMYFGYWISSGAKGPNMCPSLSVVSMNY